MTSERWRQIQQLYHLAVEQSADSRSAFLAEACQGDGALRAEIESLLAAEEGSDDYLETPALHVAAKVRAPEEMLAEPDQPARLGRYQVTEKLGAGGMGTVYRGIDPAIGRTVAIKSILQDRLGSPKEAAQLGERLRREAQAAGNLTHPNIVTVFDVGEDAGINYIVMELIRGCTLEEMLSDPGTPLAIGRVLTILAEAAAALDFAHSHGVVHRDVKPSNIMIQVDGTVKLADFGIARRVAAVNVSLTGGLIGSPQFMAPEQLRGQEITPRSDQYSLAVVAWILLTGTKPFDGAELLTVISKVLTEEPPAKERLDTAADRVLRRALAKDPQARFESCRSFVSALRDACIGNRELPQKRERPSETTGSKRVAAVPKSIWRVTGAAIVAVFVILAALLTAGLIGPAHLDLGSFKFTPLAQDEALESNPAWGPDGKSIAYTESVHGLLQIFVKAINSPDHTQLTRSVMSCWHPFWAPVGATVYYHSGGGLWAVAPTGGTPERILDHARMATIRSDGKTMSFEREGAIWIGPPRGGPAREFWRPPRGTEFPGAVLFEWSAFSPDGSKLAVMDAANNLWIVPYPSGLARNLRTIPPYGAAWFPDNRHLMIMRDELNGFDSLDSIDGSREAFYRGPETFTSPSISLNGKRIACAVGSVIANAVEISLPDGRLRAMAAGVGNLGGADWAPSGTHYLISVNRGWVERSVVEDRSTADGFMRRVAEPPPGQAGGVADGRWSPDGSRFVFNYSQGAKAQLTVASASGGPWARVADISNAPFNSYAWSPDGQWIVFFTMEGGRQRLFKVRPVAGSIPEPLNVAPALSLYEFIQWSPRGDAILYSDGHGLSTVSPDGQTVHKVTHLNLSGYGFSRDGAQVFGGFHNTAGKGTEWELFSVNVQTGAEKMLASLDLPASTQSLYGFSLHPDGKRFLTTVLQKPFDIWMIEGFQPPHSRNWLERFSEWLRAFGRPLSTRS
jgi:serine/threonine protein kinase